MRLGLMVIVAVCILIAVPLVRVAHGADGETVAAAPAAGPPAIAGSRAGDYVGQEVTIEGRVAAIHESPLATVLAFAPNFAGFTATILAGDRDKFPSDLEARLRDRLVRVTGTVTAYRGKPEMALRDPSQLILAPPPGPGSVAAHSAPAPAATPDAAMEDMRRILGRIETRLDALDTRLRAVEQADTGRDDLDAPAADTRPRR